LVTSTYPPYDGLAAGPNNLVTAEGSRIEWTNPTGGAPVLQSIYDFFAPLGASATNSLSHPRQPAPAWPSRSRSRRLPRIIDYLLSPLAR
jgi:hypothetical protein